MQSPEAWSTLGLALTSRYGPCTDAVNQRLLEAMEAYYQDAQGDSEGPEDMEAYYQQAAAAATPETDVPGASTSDKAMAFLTDVGSWQEESDGEDIGFSNPSAYAAASQEEQADVVDLQQMGSSYGLVPPQQGEDGDSAGQTGGTELGAGWSGVQEPAPTSDVAPIEATSAPSNEPAAGADDIDFETADLDQLMADDPEFALLEKALAEFESEVLLSPSSSRESDASADGSDGDSAAAAASIEAAAGDVEEETGNAAVEGGTEQSVPKSASADELLLRLQRALDSNPSLAEGVEALLDQQQQQQQPPTAQPETPSASDAEPGALFSTEESALLSELLAPVPRGRAQATTASSQQPDVTATPTMQQGVQNSPTNAAEATVTDVSTEAREPEATAMASSTSSKAAPAADPTSAAAGQAVDPSAVKASPSPEVPNGSADFESSQTSIEDNAGSESRSPASNGGNSADVAEFIPSVKGRGKRGQATPTARRQRMQREQQQSNSQVAATAGASRSEGPLSNGGTGSVEAAPRRSPILNRLLQKGPGAKAPSDANGRTSPVDAAPEDEFAAPGTEDRDGGSSRAPAGARRSGYLSPDAAAASQQTGMAAAADASRAAVDESAGDGSNSWGYQDGVLDEFLRNQNLDRSALS